MFLVHFVHLTFCLLWNFYYPVIYCSALIPYDLNFFSNTFSCWYGICVMRPLLVIILPTHERFAVCARVTTNIVPPIINLDEDVSVLRSLFLLSVTLITHVVLLQRYQSRTVKISSRHLQAGSHLVMHLKRNHFSAVFVWTFSYSRLVVA